MDGLAQHPAVTTASQQARQRRAWLLTLTATAVLVSLSPPSAAAAPKGGSVQAAQRLAGEAKAAYLARDYDRAVALFADALKQFEHENLFFTYGRSLEQTSQFKAAAFAFGRAEALTPAGPAKTVAAERATANAKLDEAQQVLTDGDAQAALPMARAAHAVLFGQSKRAADGENYPEPATVLLLLARVEQGCGHAEAAQQLLGEVRADPTAAVKVLERAEQLAKAGGSDARVVAVPVEVKPVAVKTPIRAEPKAVPMAVSPVELVPVVAKAATSGKGRPVAAWSALGVSSAVALGGAYWWWSAGNEGDAIAAKVQAAKAVGGPVVGMSQQEFVAAKAQVDRGYAVAPVVALVGAAAAVGSVIWLATSGGDAATAKSASVVVVPLPCGGVAAVAGAAW